MERGEDCGTGVCQSGGVFRLGAKSLSRAKGYFAAFFRRIRARLGTAKAIAATAHKLARVVYHVLHSKEPYTDTVFHRCDEQEQQRAAMRFVDTPPSSDPNSS